LTRVVSQMRNHDLLAMLSYQDVDERDVPSRNTWQTLRQASRLTRPLQVYDQLEI
jgi:hypothetical protein